MPRGRRKRRRPPDETQNFYTVWADFNSFLMILFLLLYTFVMNNVSEEEQQQVYESIRVSLQGQYLQPQIDKEKPDKESQSVVDKVVQYINEQKLSEFLQVMVEESKVRIILAQPILFDTGKAELKPLARDVLADIGLILKQTKNKIIIEGHTDDVPIHNAEYDSNWELSFDRSYSVVKYLISQVGIAPGRIHAIGYGEFRPLMPNDSEENRAKNRRIEINILLQEVFVSNTNVGE